MDTNGCIPLQTMDKDDDWAIDFDFNVVIALVMPPLLLLGERPRQTRLCLDAHKWNAFVNVVTSLTQDVMGKASKCRFCS
jgi:hypothetical protein